MWQACSLPAAASAACGATVGAGVWFVWGAGALQALRQLPQFAFAVRKETDGPVAAATTLTKERLEPA
jgi:hypothetical protein